MGPVHEAESLRAQLQQNHIQHVRVQIDLAITFLDLSRVEYDMGELETGDRCLLYAHQAVNGALRGLGRIASPECRAEFDWFKAIFAPQGIFAKTKS